MAGGVGGGGVVEEKGGAEGLYEINCHSNGPAASTPQQGISKYG